MHGHAPARHGFAAPRPPRLTRRVQRKQKPHECPASAVALGGGVWARHAAQGLAHHAGPEQCRRHQACGVAATLAFLRGQCVGCVPVVAAEHAGGITLDNVKRCTVGANHPWHACSAKSHAQLRGAVLGHEHVVVGRWLRGRADHCAVAIDTLIVAPTRDLKLLTVLPLPLCAVASAAMQARRAAAVARCPARLGKATCTRPVPGAQVVRTPAVLAHKPPAAAWVAPDAPPAALRHDLD
eukprot:5083479-Prymnesium_polylepis.1